MDFPTIANLAVAFAVIVAVVFGMVQLRQLNAQRRHEAAFALMRSIQSPQMLRGILIIDRLQDALQMVDDFYSGTVQQSWPKLQRYVEELREATAGPTRWEWFQWLAERMQERESDVPPVPAHTQHRKWTRLS